MVLEVETNAGKIDDRLDANLLELLGVAWSSSVSGRRTFRLRAWHVGTYQCRIAAE